MAKFNKDVEVRSTVPTGSMADIAFLLLIFFMATTIFRIEEGLDVTLPRAISGQKLPRQNLAHIWVDARGQISIDDALLQVEQIMPVMQRKVEENKQLVVAFNTDAQVPYRLMHDIMEQLKEASSTNVAFNHDKKSGG